MENHSYNSYPESGGSTPRSREIDFDHPPPWEDQAAGNYSNINNYRVKLMCSYGGKIHPRPHDNQLAYIGGETKILAVDRMIKFSALIAKLAAVCDGDVCVKYQLPGEDLDALISVTDDDDLEHMMSEYDRLNRGSAKPARLRLFLFPVAVQTPIVTPAGSFGQYGSTEGRSDRERFVDALNSSSVQPSTPPSAVPMPTHGNADFLFGSEKGVIPVPAATVAKVRDPVADPPIRQNEPDLSILDDRGIGAARIQEHIQDLRRLRIAEEQQQTLYTRQSDDSGFAGDYYVQRTAEKAPSTALQGSVPSPASGGYKQLPTSADQQPIYMPPAPSMMYHAPMARPVTSSAGQTQNQGYYAVQRTQTEVYRDQQLYNALQPVQSMPRQPPQMIPTHSEGIRIVQSKVAMNDPGYAQVAYENSVGLAYDNSVARHVYYTAQGNLVTPQQYQQQPLQQTQQLLQQTSHQYQGVAVPLNQESKVISPPKITQGSI